MEENTTLREKNDILFALGKDYIEKKNKGTQQSNRTQNENEEDRIEILEEIQQNFDQNTSKGWKAMKERGFKKVNKTQSNRKTNENSRSVPQKTNENRTESSSFGTPQEEERHHMTRFCHYFVNEGRCRFGDRCKFKHAQAPECREGSYCRRNKCMFSHQNGRSQQQASNQSFLSNFQPTNTWQLPNPWMFPFQGGIQNISPWMENQQASLQRQK